MRHQGKEVIALGVSMAKGGDIIALGKALRARRRSDPGRAAGGHRDERRCRTSRRRSSRSVGEFVRVLIEAVVIVLAVSFIAWACTPSRCGIDIWPGLVVGITIPLVLAITFVAMYYWGVGLHKISLGSLIIALGLLVDDAIIAVEMMVRKLEEGYDKMRAATFAYDVDRDADADRHADHRRRLPADRPGASRSTGEYTFAIFAVTAAALLISWLVSVYFVPYLGALLLRSAAARPTATARTSCSTRRSTRASAALVDWCVRAPLDHDRRSRC